MKIHQPRRSTTGMFPQLSGKVGWILLWLIGIPVPVLIGLFLIRGCT
ncbi:MAG: hypothetical protein V4640_08360 [Verrucomicrobiota bacterium]